MSVFRISSYVVKPDRQEEYKEVWRRWLKFKKENPEEVSEIRSSGLFTQTFGDTYGKYVEMHEFDSMADYERYMEKAFNNRQHMEIFEDQMSLFVPGTVSMSIWNPVELSTL